MASSGRIVVPLLLLVSWHAAASASRQSDVRAMGKFHAFFSNVSKEVSRSLPDEPAWYQKYVTLQRTKTDALAAKGQAATQFVYRKQMDDVASVARRHVQFVTRFALCHGVRSGRETVWLREGLAAEKVQVWGTELSPVAAASASWTVTWDFHKARPEWLGAADVVYSNSLDHSYNATLAIVAWMNQVQPRGALLIQWDTGRAVPISDAKRVANAIDIFAASTEPRAHTVPGLPTLYL